MNLTNRTIFIISGDLILAQRCFEELAAFGGEYRTMVVGTVEQARKKMGRSAPAAVFLDESAIDIAGGGETLESAVALLTESASVVVAGPPEKQAGMAFLITSGALDFVVRSGEFCADRRGHAGPPGADGRAGGGDDPISKRRIIRRFRRNSSPRSEQSADRNSREYRASTRAARPAPARRRRAAGNHRGTSRPFARNRPPSFQCLGRAPRACAARVRKGGRLQVKRKFTNQTISASNHPPPTTPHLRPATHYLLLGSEQYVFPLK